MRPASMWYTAGRRELVGEWNTQEDGDVASVYWLREVPER